jgi:ABC-type glycerol-3-phosphate transport system substrate-binding protein
LADVSDIAEEIGKKQGGWCDAAKEAAVVNGKWKTIPLSNIGQLMNWRTDWFAEVGFKTFPETWDELYEAGTKLKANDHPFGFELGPRLWRQSRLALPASVVLRRCRGRARRQDRRDRLG